MTAQSLKARQNVVTIPDASASVSGVVNTGAQTFAGAKTWSGDQNFNTKITAGPATRSVEIGDLGQAKNVGVVATPERFSLAQGASTTMTIPANGGIAVITNDRSIGTAVYLFSYASDTITSIVNTSSLIVIGTPGTNQLGLTKSGTTVTFTQGATAGTAKIGVMWLGISGAVF